MNRLLSILISLFVLFLVYLWINHIMQGPPSSEFPDETTTRVIEKDMDPKEPAAVIPDKMPTEKQNDELASDEKTPETNNRTTPVDNGNKTEPDQPKEEARPAEKKAPAKPSAPPSATGSSSGAHLVLAGNFLEQVNAEKRASQLRENGYPNAEVVRFQLSQYHTVCAGRFDDLREARNMVRRLKSDQGIDAYVRIGN